jgi:hypothetical protein
MLLTVRFVVGVVAGLMVLSGIAAIAAGWPFAGAGLWSVAIGGIGLVLVAFERMRYRSDADEVPSPGSGPGGDVGAPLDPRFSATGEVFVDPTTGQRMRVYLDASTGERRYHVE